MAIRHTFAIWVLSGLLGVQLVCADAADNLMQKNLLAKQLSQEELQPFLDSTDTLLTETSGPPIMLPEEQMRNISLNFQLAFRFCLKQIEAEIQQNQIEKALQLLDQGLKQQTLLLHYKNPILLTVYFHNCAGLIGLGYYPIINRVILPAEQRNAYQRQFKEILKTVARILAEEWEMRQEFSTRYNAVYRVWNTLTPSSAQNITAETIFSPQNLALFLKEQPFVRHDYTSLDAIRRAIICNAILEFYQTQGRLPVSVLEMTPAYFRKETSYDPVTGTLYQLRYNQKTLQATIEAPSQNPDKPPFRWSIPYPPAPTSAETQEKAK